ncbi:MAG TPA: hypothetical protein VKR06_24825 [Ktedonosporobacter sp.]|nr:hypothetical protein [Ktedonosporobacter sp.]
MQTISVTSEQARRLILNGEAPAGLNVSGGLDLSDCTSLTTLPAGLRVKRLVLDECSSLRELPRDLQCFDLSMHATPITSLPADLKVEYRLDLSNCDMLEALPAGLKVGSLILRECTSLRALPEDLDVFFLDIPGCVGLTGFPARGPARMGRLNMRGCTRLCALPSWLKRLSQLDVSGCSNLQALPEGLQVSSWLDLAHTPIKSLPASLQGVQLRWRGVAINERIAFHPETFSAQEVLNERNTEVRRVLFERVGYETFMEQAHAEVLDQDQDPGGTRRLLRVPLTGDEPLVCLGVYCPSTGRQYLLRVPPTMCSCHQAAAWIAGFDDPDQYRPLDET